MLQQQYQKLRKLAAKYNVPVYIFDRMPGGQVKLAKTLGAAVGLIAWVHGTNIFKKAGVDIDDLLNKLYNRKDL
jgi:hypothetical protein